MSTKVRLDQLLVDRGLFASVKEAAAAIMSGEVKVSDTRITQAGTQVDADVPITCAQKGRFVSRGGEKLQGALDAFGIDVTSLSCIDVGASTGGFTDCLLQAGAAHVSAVDVGYGQLAWSLQNDSRVSIYDRTNIRAADPQELGAPFDVLVCDASFISLKKLLKPFKNLTKEGGTLLVLVKPQFEVSKTELSPKGVVDDAAVHTRVINEVIETAQETGLTVQGLTYSPITGPQGNKEFLLWLVHREAQPTGEHASYDVEATVREAHQAL